MLYWSILSPTLVSFGLGGVYKELHSSYRVDLGNQYPSTIPHSIYYTDICILHIVKVILTLISERVQIRRYILT